MADKPDWKEFFDLYRHGEIKVRTPGRGVRTFTAEELYQIFEARRFDEEQERQMKAYRDRPKDAY